MASVEDVIKNQTETSQTADSDSCGVQFDVSTWSALATIIIGISTAIRLYIDLKKGDI